MLFTMFNALAKAAKLSNMGTVGKALELLKAARVKHPDDPRYWIQLGWLLAENGRTQEALDELRSCVETFPHVMAAHLFAGIVALETGAADQAETYFSTVAERQPANSLAHAYLALARCVAGNESAALELLRKHGLSDNLGFLVRMTEWAEEQWLEQGRFFAPKHIDLGEPLRLRVATRLFASARAERLFYQKRYREFLVFVEAMNKTRAVDESILFAAGMAAELMGDYERALSYWDRIVEQEGDAYDPLRAARGRVWVRLGDYDQALELLSRVTILGPEDYGVNYFLGVMCLAHGDRLSARRFFTRAFTDYLVDTLEYQYAHLLRAVLAEIAVKTP